MTATATVKQPRVGDVQVTRGEEYDRPGEWAVEEFAYWHGDYKPSWAVPGWVEDRFGETGFFPTKEQALAFLDVVLS